MIEQIKIKEFTVLKNFEYDFSGRNVLICGKNAIGKSSIMKFIRVARGEQEIIPPNAKGEGEVWETKNGEKYYFKVKIENGKSKVTVTGPDGMSSSQKGVIANLMGAQEFNINEFVEMSKTEKGRKQQVEIFKSFLPEDVRKEIERLEENVRVAFEERTQLNREIKTKDTEVKANPMNILLPKQLDAIKPVDVSATMTELKAIQDANAKVQKVLDNKVARAEEIVAETEAIRALQEKLDAKIKLQADAEEWLVKNKLQSTTEKEEIIRNATKANTDFANAEKLKKDKELLEKMVSESEDYTAKIGSQRQAIQDAIKDMSGDFVPGLTFDETGLIWNDVPVHSDTHSTSERIELGILMKIAENPENDVLFIEHTESIDEDRWKNILQIAKKHGLQVIAEEVRKNQKEMTLELIAE